MCMNMCIIMWCIDMCIGMCVDMCIDMRMDICMDVHTLVEFKHGLGKLGIVRCAHTCQCVQACEFTCVLACALTYAQSHPLGRLSHTIGRLLLRQEK